ncbi:MAG TPA: M3 family metallopeptidase [Pyrinomonadaceae bacterium]|nr:M3 family metallopeptidase [Pyrinomonadaceae bacterium]
MCRNILACFLLFGLIAPIFAGINNQTTANIFMNEINEPNPLTSVWTGNYGGVPPFDKVKIEYFEPAIESAMSENLAEIDKIANDTAAPNFENTIAAMERSGETLNRVSTIYFIWQSNMNSPEFAEVSRKMGPKFAELGDKISQNEKLFKRIETVYQARNKSKLTPEQKRLVEDYYTNFVRGGAKLGEKEKVRVGEINQRLATLFNQFSQNLLADESKYLVLESEADLKGLPQSLVDAAAAQATARKANSKWIVVNTRSSVDPFLTYSERRDLREKVWKMFINRGDNGDEHDNNAIIPEILQLRAERAKLLGYPTHAHFRLDVAMAKTPENAMKLMLDVWKPAVARVHEEVADMQALANKEGANITIEPWDYRFYMEKVRKAKYDLDQNEIKPYLQLDKLREGMFYVAGELFGFNFTPVTGVPTFHPDVKVWEVTNRKTGKHIGLWYFDPYAREGKRSGAWMNAYRNQQRMNGEVTTIVSNNANFVKGKPGEPLLISWDDATTLFHEFGHALHGLNSNVTYPTLSGTNVARDYVEFPSQLLEHWLSTPEVLNKYAVHYQTGKPIPQELVDKINKSSKFNQGFGTVEYLASALVDMKLHLAGNAKIDADKFERDTLAELGMPKELVMRHRTPQFGHVFQSDGYSAGYYSYLWSDVITADAFGAFTEAGGPYDKNVAARLVKYIFSVGNTIDPAEGYRKFRGRDPKVEALMIKRGFALEPTKSKKAKGKK